MTREDAQGTVQALIRQIPEMEAQITRLETMHFALQTQLDEKTPGEHASAGGVQFGVDTLVHRLNQVKRENTGEYILTSPNFDEDDLNTLRVLLKKEHGVGSILSTPVEADSVSSLYMYPDSDLTDSDLRVIMYNILNPNVALPKELSVGRLDAIAADEEAFEL